jgi:hypothetical protein
MTPITPSEEFLRHAAECESMAKFSHDPGSKAVWRGMAERWMRCAELAKVHGSIAARTKVKGRNAHQSAH